MSDGMTPEAQRIAISEACGYSDFEIDNFGLILAIPSYNKHLKRGEGLRSVPDYLNDLNAMHEAEKGLTVGQLRRMTVELHDIMSQDESLDWIPVHHATAAQRAEALLKTLGLWK